MTELYSVANISKQAIHQHRKRNNAKQTITQQVIAECAKVRKNHPRMSCRKMFVRMKKPIGIGRDIFEQIGFANGFKVHVIRNKKRTTWATKLAVYDNHLEGSTLNGINQAMQSDIFYYKDHYGISIIDVYSRRLLALHASKYLTADQNVKALRKAMKERKDDQLDSCIFHSDRGSQYISEVQKELLKELKMVPSMCKLPQENAYAERVQGTIKQEYLIANTNPEIDVQKRFNQIMWLYNNERPHKNLGNKTPVEFEAAINKMPLKTRPQMTVYKWTHPLLTKVCVIDKKEKSSKKEKNQHNLN